MGEPLYGVASGTGGQTGLTRDDAGPRRRPRPLAGPVTLLAGVRGRDGRLPSARATFSTARSSMGWCQAGRWSGLDFANAMARTQPHAAGRTRRDRYSGGGGEANAARRTSSESKRPDPPWMTGSRCKRGPRGRPPASQPRLPKAEVLVLCFVDGVWGCIGRSRPSGLRYPNSAPGSFRP